ncbi:MAG: nucleotidyltransferase family protein [Actinomycetota bacterium]
MEFKVSGIVLAGGMSSRLGQPKQLLELGGRPVLQYVLDAATRGGLEEIVVVLGHAATRVSSAIRLPAGARCVVNPDFATGQASSLASGLRAVSPEARAALILLGDQPRVGADTIRSIVEAYRRSGALVVQARYRGTPGHPVLLDRGVWAQVEAVEGDRGARDLLASHPEWMHRVDVDAELPADIDTWEDYERLQRGEGRSSSRPPPNTRP